MIKCRIAMRVADARKHGLTPLDDKLYMTEEMDLDSWHPDCVKIFKDHLDISVPYPALLRSPLTGKPLVLTSNTESALLAVLNHPDRENPIHRGGRPRKTSGKCTVRMGIEVINELLDVIHKLNGVPPARALKYLESAARDTHVSESSGLASSSRPEATSKTPGVCFCSRSGKWRATLGTEYLGTFVEEVDAKDARKKAEEALIAAETSLSDNFKHFKS